MGALGSVLGALEHHVLEEVGEAGAAGFLGARSDAVDDIDGDHGNGVVGEKITRRPFGSVCLRMGMWSGVIVR